MTFGMKDGSTGVWPLVAVWRNAVSGPEPLAGSDHAAAGGKAPGGARAVREQRDEQSVEGSRGAWLPPAAVPPVMAASELISGLASGMTVSFFPIFLAQEVGLSPTSLSLLLALVPAGLAAASCAARAASQHLGRVPTIAAFKTAGISLLVALAVRPSLWRRPAFVLPVYAVRTVLMNATPALQKSILVGRWGRWQVPPALGRLSAPRAERPCAQSASQARRPRHRP